MYIFYMYYVYCTFSAYLQRQINLFYMSLITCINYLLCQLYLQPLVIALKYLT